MKYFIIFLLASITLIGCVKETDFLSENDKNTSNLKTSRDIPGNLSEEAKNLFSLYQKKDYHVGLISTNNFGQFMGSKSSGRTSNDFSFIIEGKKMIPDNNNSIEKVNNSFNEYFGKKVNFQIEDSNSKKEYELYIPNSIQANQLSKGQSSYIGRTGNTLSWEADKNNKSGILIRYQLRDKDVASEGSKIISNGYEWLEDIGKYNIDHLLKDPSVNAITFTISRANAINFVNRESKNVLVSFKANDHHYYIIGDS